jgi:hypothetical protein
MAKKTNRKNVKALPSALSIASPVESRPEVAPASVTETSEPLVSVSPPAASEPPPKRAVTKAALAPSQPQVPVVFELHDPQAKVVSLCGEFNCWSQEANPLQLQADGVWRTTLPLAPGRYQYKFVVDGQWCPDAKAKENVLNEHGTLNSVVVVAAGTRTI